VLDGLDPEQRQVALALEGPVCVLAGAGTGKTRAVTHRIAYGIHRGVYAPAEVLAVTFTTRAAGEMRARLGALGAAGLQARTFHSAALRQARYFWPHVYGAELPRLTASKLDLLRRVASRSRLPADKAMLRDLAGEIEWAKVCNVRPDDYPAAAQRAGRAVGNLDAATTARAYSTYEEVKREFGWIDMEDALLCAAAVLAEDERAAAQVRRQYRWFVVDEFQDVSPVQQRLLDLWLGERDDVCVVGDAAQTIYSFAGATADHLLDFARHYPRTQVVSLVRNYRSTPQVVDAANRLMRSSAHRSDATRRQAGGHQHAILELRAQRGDGSPVRYLEHPDEVAEAAAIAAEIVQLRDEGTALSDVAVLFRINAQSEVFEEALSARGLPYVVRGVERFFERAEVRQAVTLVRGAARAGEDGGDKAGKGLAAELAEVLSGMGWSATPPPGAGAVRSRWESLQALLSLAEEIGAEDPAAGLRAFVDEVDRRRAVQHAPVAEGVTLATLHAAKGLEWEAVFLAGVQDGTVPLSYADTAAAIAEERRLLYVGMTRARSRLCVSWSRARAPGGRASRQPSRFLDGLRPSTPSGTGPLRQSSDSRRTRRAGVARCRVCSRPLAAAAERKVGRCANCPGDADEALYERLRSWRLERAKAEHLPAFCVFTDATLSALAEVRPADPAALVRIPGIGTAKAAKYGAEVLEMCRSSGG
jgi:DNA helicase-2/ATP-dependent DNA helicase PcrA